MNINEVYNIFLKYPSISTDTRDIKPDSIFFSLKGDNFNGNIFADKAIEKGAIYAIIDESKFKKDSRYILVDNALDNLQQLAIIHRNHLKIPIIGITGTNGKTTTKELINCILSPKYKTLATQGNLNNHIGVPLTVLSITNEHEIAIIEMGANHIGEIGELCRISQPDFGIITNIGKAHLEGFGNLEGVIKTKNDLYLEVAKKNGKLFVNADNPILNNLSENIDRICYGKSSTNYCYGNLKKQNAFINIEYYCDSNYDLINTQLVGFYNFENILAAITIGCYFKIEKQFIKKALENYLPTNSRSQIVKSKTNTIILDAYNANPSSLEASIKNFAEIVADNKILMIGDMLELGEYSEVEHRNILHIIEMLNFNNVILVGPQFSSVCEKKDWLCFKNSMLAKDWLILNPIKNAYVLIKGSRGIKMEVVLESL
jgi:UDP-N-acetylmuramoyl-tripeptide--D-alanyl-D-alanine ligase